MDLETISSVAGGKFSVRPDLASSLVPKPYLLLGLHTERAGLGDEAKFPEASAVSIGLHDMICIGSGFSSQALCEQKRTIRNSEFLLNGIRNSLDLTLTKTLPHLTVRIGSVRLTTRGFHMLHINGKKAVEKTF